MVRFCSLDTQGDVSSMNTLQTLLWLGVKAKLVKFYHEAIPELVFPRYTSSQTIRKPLDRTSITDSLHETEQQLDKDDRDPR